MDKKQISATLKKMAVMMEISGSNPFKVRAHENAARILEGLTASIAELVESGEITNIKGIGKGMTDKITLLLNDEVLEEYEELKASIPEGVMEMTGISGMGPKKIKAIWQQQGITSVDALEAACKEDKLSDMKGFGKKTQEKILRNIELLRKFKDSFLLSEAKPAGEDLLASIQAFPGVMRAEVAGSLRRSKEVVKDIDIVVSAEKVDRVNIMQLFTSLPNVESIVGQGETKSSIVLKSGINADLRIVSDEQFPNTLHHFTGSKEHNVALRQRAISMGMKVSEYGLFRGEELIKCEDEKELFTHLGLDFISPELRENFGEIEAAAEKRLPKLVKGSDIRGIIHTHTTYSDGANTVEEMARGCQSAGYEYIVISDHSKSAAYANGLSEERIIKQHAEIDEVNSRLDGFRILKGIECDILADGRMDYSDEVLASFEVVIASIHSKFGMTEKEATDRVIRALENPYVNILGHLTGRLLLSREGYPLDQRAVIDAAGELGVSIEINANPHRLDMDWRYCQYAIEKGVMMSVNPDSHRVAGFSDMQYGIGMARKGWLSKEQVLNTYSADEVLAFVNKRRH
ncbi:MAG: DNA polymerase/3'-5' exonuclease PolX [Calditrichia bacterium]